MLSRARICELIHRAAPRCRFRLARAKDGTPQAVWFNAERLKTLIRHVTLAGNALSDAGATVEFGAMVMSLRPKRVGYKWTCKIHISRGARP
jgi:hypothetical protein